MSVIDEDIGVKFSRQTDYRVHYSKKCKIRSKAVGKGSRGLLLKFCDPLHISGTVEARNFKFGMQIDTRDTI